jgi:hypothetical protein
MVYTLHSRGYTHFRYSFYSDEAWFHLIVYVDSQNSRIWCAENSHTFHERPLHSVKVRIWCVVSQQRAVGSIFFIETITAECYQELIMNFIFLLEVDEQDCWLQRAGATAHTANSTMQMLSEFFGGYIISRILWPLDPRIYCHHISMGVFEGEHVQKQPTHIRRIERKY